MKRKKKTARLFFITSEVHSLRQVFTCVLKLSRWDSYLWSGEWEQPPHTSLSETPWLKGKLTCSHINNPPDPAPFFFFTNTNLSTPNTPPAQSKPQNNEACSGFVRLLSGLLSLHLNRKQKFIISFNIKQKCII